MQTEGPRWGSTWTRVDKQEQERRDATGDKCLGAAQTRGAVMSRKGGNGHNNARWGAGKLGGQLRPPSSQRRVSLKMHGFARACGHCNVLLTKRVRDPMCGTGRCGIDAVVVRYGTGRTGALAFSSSWKGKRLRSSRLHIT